MMIIRRSGGLLLTFCVLAFGVIPAMADPRQSYPGPVVAVPECRVADSGCSLDPSTPDLNPAACARALAGLLRRRGMGGTVAGVGVDVCAADPNALVLQTELTALCPMGSGATRMREALRTVLRADLEMRDCATGAVVGRSRAERSVKAGRVNLLRDAMEELGHNVSAREVRRSHPGTPLGWFGSDVGGEQAIEVTAGTVDIKDGEFNDFLKASHLDTVNNAYHVSIESVRQLIGTQRVRIGYGIEWYQIEQAGDGFYDPRNFSQDPDPNLNPPGPAHIDASILVVGFIFDSGYGFDFTRNQRIAGRVKVGYYQMGTLLSPTQISIEGQPEKIGDLQDSVLGWGAEIRYEWRFTPHLGFSVGAGWNGLNFRSPNVMDRDRFFPYDIDLRGIAYNVGLSGRW